MDGGNVGVEFGYDGPPIYKKIGLTKNCYMDSVMLLQYVQCDYDDQRETGAHI